MRLPEKRESVVDEFVALSVELGQQTQTSLLASRKHREFLRNSLFSGVVFFNLSSAGAQIFNFSHVPVASSGVLQGEFSEYSKIDYNIEGNDFMHHKNSYLTWMNLREGKNAQQQDPNDCHDGSLKTETNTSHKQVRREFQTIKFLNSLWKRGRKKTMRLDELCERTEALFWNKNFRCLTIFLRI